MAVPHEYRMDPVVQLTAFRGGADLIQKSGWWKEVTQGEVDAPD